MKLSVPLAPISLRTWRAAPWIVALAGLASPAHDESFAPGGCQTEAPGSR